MYTIPVNNIYIYMSLGHAAFSHISAFKSLFYEVLPRFCLNHTHLLPQPSLLDPSFYLLSIFQYLKFLFMYVTYLFLSPTPML